MNSIKKLGKIPKFISLISTNQYPSLKIVGRNLLCSPFPCHAIETPSNVSRPKLHKSQAASCMRCVSVIDEKEKGKCDPGGYLVNRKIMCEPANTDVDRIFNRLRYVDFIIQTVGYSKIC